MYIAGEKAYCLSMYKCNNTNPKNEEYARDHSESWCVLVN